MKAGEVIVYVEGRSDESAMEALLEPLLQQKRQEGVVVRFFPAPPGHNKESVITRVPQTAVNIICNNKHSVVVAMPDLYPRDKPLPHTTFDELEALILSEFDTALRDRNAENDIRLKGRFKVFCFKHDLEALILASEEALKRRLGTEQFDVVWQVPVEDQDHNHPPKRVVEELFEKHGQSYQAPVDAPLILRESHYQDIANKCCQCFKPFVEFLAGLRPVSYHD